jgi:hypothetical protein
VAFGLTAVVATAAGVGWVLNRGHSELPPQPSPQHEQAAAVDAGGKEAPSEAAAPGVDAGPAVAVAPELAAAPDAGHSPKPVAVAAAAPKGTGKVDLRVTPWAEVFEGKKSLGVTPLPPIELTVGTHQLTLKNSDLNVSRNVTVKVSKGGTVLERVDLSH